MKNSDDLAQTAIEFRAERGAEWIETLPALVSDLARRWSLTVGPPFPRLSYNFAAPAVRADGMPVVLKICHPDGEDITFEAEALRLCDGHGMAQLLELDVDQRAMLIEQLVPGTSLLRLPETEAITIAASVLRRLWRPAPADHPFPLITDWGRGFSRLRNLYAGTSGPLPDALFDEAEKLFAELADSSAEPALLHGDLHYENIMSARREPWLAIDPKGVVGEPAYDTGDLLRNRLEELFALANPVKGMERRVHQLADELGSDRERIRAWGLAQAVLSAIWTVEDDDGSWDGAIASAELLAGMKP